LKKVTKKLSVLRVVATALPRPAGPKVFLLLFLQKKKFFLNFLGRGEICNTV